MAETGDVREDPKVAEALADLQSYLSDAISPLVVAESLELLLACPPQVVAAEVEAWTAAQYRRQGATIPVSDYLFHAVRKLHLVGEFKLVPGESLDGFLTGLKDAVMAYCPEDDRELLRENLSRLGEARTAMTQPVTILHRQMGTEQPLAVGETAPQVASVVPPTVTAATLPGQDQARAHRRLGLLMQRLEHQLQQQVATPGSDPAKRAELVTSLLAQAAATSRSPEELGQLREDLRLRGLEARMDEVFRLLSRSLPTWSPPTGQASPGSGQDPVGGGAAGAMRRLLALDHDPVEGAKRFIAMVDAAIELVNTGSLGRGAAMLDAARQGLAERRVDTATVQTYLEHAHEKLDKTHLRAAAEDPGMHEALARVLGFFPATSPDRLLDALGGEEKRERRRHLLALLEAVGAQARPLIWRRLTESVATFGDRDAFLQRNLLLLMRRIQRPETTSLEDEMDLATALSSPVHPLTLVKEAVAYLGQTKHPKAEEALVQRAAELEHLVLHPEAGKHSPADLLSALDRVIHALARFGSPAAHRAVVDHGLRQQPQLGDTSARLTYLAGQDLAPEAETTSRLLLALEAELPRKFLGIAVRSSADRALHIIEALSTTPAQVVKTTLADIAARFKGHSVGEAACRALAGLDAARATAEAQPLTLSGDLEIFGLPNLLQHLAQSEACGTLSIHGARGQLVASLVFDGGAFVGARHGRLEGEAAVYQLLERPVTATFQFAGRRSVPGQARRQGRDVLPLLLEGQRRYDELLQVAALIPDDATFRVGENQHTTPSFEKDSTVVQSVWLAAISGARVTECEADHATDSYRIRRLLARWVEEGALTIR